MNLIIHHIRCFLYDKFVVFLLMYVFTIKTESGKSSLYIENSLKLVPTTALISDNDGIRFIFCTRNAFLWEKKEFFLPKTGVICEKTLLQGASELFQTASREFFSTKSRLLWEKFNLDKLKICCRRQSTKFFINICYIFYILTDTDTPYFFIYCF